MNIEQELQSTVASAFESAVSAVSALMIERSSAYVTEPRELALAAVVTFLDRLPDKVIDYYYCGELARLVRRQEGARP